MQVRHKDRNVYFEESATSCRNYYIPYIKEFVDSRFDENYKVLEIGCSISGNLAAFASLGCDVTGVDSYKPFLEMGKGFFEDRGLKGTFINSDIFDYDNEGKLFDLLILHDVIEHIVDKENLLLHLKKFLKEDGVLYIGFPAWQMPFGGHHQMAKSKLLANFPYLHLLPKRLFVSVFKMFGEKEGTINSLLEVRDARISIEGFERLIKKTKYNVVNRRLYFINPHYHVKFGLKPRRLSPIIRNIPYLRNFFTTTCYYLLKK